MAERYQPAENQPELPPLATIDDRAEVTEEEAREFGDRWQENPPIEEFDEILDAEEEPEEEEANDDGN